MHRTYQAFTFEEALERIRVELGADAIVLHSRTFKRGGLFGFGGKNIVEVTASTPAPRPKTTRKPKAQPTANGKTRKAELRPQSRPAPAAIPSGKPTPDSNAQLAQSLSHLIQRARRFDSLSTPATLKPEPITQEPVSPPPAAAPMHDHRHVPRPIQRKGPPSRKPVATDPPVPRRFILQPADETQRSVNPAPPAPTPPPARIITPHTPPPAKSRNPSDRTESSKPAAQNDNAWLSDMAALKTMVGQVLQRQSGNLTPAMPDLLLEQYTMLIENEVARELADEVCFAVRDELDQAALNDREKVRAALCSHLAAYIAVSDNPTQSTTADNRPFTLALVGPTGVGKTTTVAKLAATFKLRRNKRVGLITTDTYRIAAVDQLRTYANIIGIPLKVALTPDEIRQAREDLDYCDILLIDTAGRSPNDAQRLDEIDRFLQAADPHEVHLVLSSTLSETVLIQTIDRFSHLATDRIIFTKLDEAVSFGVLVNVMRKARKRLSYVTTGQEVPDQIEPGSAQRIARLVMGESLGS